MFFTISIFKCPLTGFSPFLMLFSIWGKVIQLSLILSQLMRYMTRLYVCVQSAFWLRTQNITTGSKLYVLF